MRSVPLTRRRAENFFGVLFRRCRFCAPVLATIIIIVPVLSIASEIDRGMWRVPENDAINSLYMFLRVHGYNENYEKYLSHVQLVRDSPTMKSLRTTSNDLGFPTEVVKGTMEQVRNPAFPKPAILFFDRSGSEYGEWYLLLYVNKDYVGLLTGGTMIINPIPVDKFLMDWSGYALVIQSHESHLGIGLRYLSLGIAGAAALTLLTRTRLRDAHNEQW